MDNRVFSQVLVAFHPYESTEKLFLYTAKICNIKTGRNKSIYKTVLVYRPNLMSNNFCTI